MSDVPTPGTPDGGNPLEQLGADEVRARAASGAALLGARGVLILVLGVAANLALARLLVPRDFGLVTLGTVAVAVGTYLGEAGAGAALIRREAPPSRAELQATNALQLAIALTLVLVCTAVAIPFGRDGLVIAVMVASLPIWALRSPSVIVVERRLQYRAIATADVVEAISYYVWAIVTVALGLGVWGLATAVIVRALAGTSTMMVVGPLGLVRPRWSWPLVRPLLGFGAKFQATALLYISREQGLNVGVGAVGGIATLGVWNLAWRILQVPALLFITVGRVAYPAMSRLLAEGENPRPLIERGAAALAALTGVVVVAVIGFAPSVPDLVGENWNDVPSVLLWSGIALILGAPVTVPTAGYLFASDQAGVVLTATLVSALAWFGVALPLIPALGAPAVGIGWVASAVLSFAILSRRTVARTGAAILAHVAGPIAVSLAAAATAWLVARAVGGTLVGAGLGVLAGELLLLAGLTAVSRSALRDTRTLVRQAVGSLRGRPGAARAPATSAVETASAAPSTSSSARWG